MRLRYIDFTKGLAIILMIFGHTMSKINCLHIWIYSFHMPIFFIICGIIMCRKGRQKSYSLLKEKNNTKMVHIRNSIFVFWWSSYIILYNIGFA